MMTSDAQRLYLLASTIVAVHLFLLALWTGTVRVMRKQYVNPEDAKLNKTERSETDHEDVLRVKRAHQNLMESAIPFFAIGFAYAMTGATKTGALAYYGTFIGARVLHTFFYLAQKQPFRTLSFATGIMALFGMAVNVFMHAF
jgi:glutathione S-transferase